MKINLSFLIVASIAGCSSPGLPEELCNRLDSCNQLSISVDECIQDIDSTLDSASVSVRDEVEYEFNLCLERPSCGGFVSCMVDLVD